MKLSSREDNTDQLALSLRGIQGRLGRSKLEPKILWENKVLRYLSVLLDSQRVLDFKENGDLSVTRKQTRVGRREKVHYKHRTLFRNFKSRITPFRLHGRASNNTWEKFKRKHR